MKTYFQLWSHWSPTPFLKKRKSCRFNIISLRYRCRVTICRPYIRRFILHRPIWIALISGTLPSNTNIWRDLDALNWICSVNHALKAYECWSLTWRFVKEALKSAMMIIDFFCTKFDGLKFPYLSTLQYSKFSWLLKVKKKVFLLSFARSLRTLSFHLLYSYHLNERKS